MCFNHDHPVDSAHALSVRPIALQTKEVYFQLFRCGNSAATAQHTHETRMMLEADEEEAMVMLNDRACNLTHKMCLVSMTNGERKTLDQKMEVICSES